MIAIFISQCHKKALIRTRRILDSYADRIGPNAWKTNITLKGLEAIEYNLKSKSSKNNSISCWIVKNKDIKLEWIIGSKKRFNEEGKFSI